ncbi:McrC family protein [Halopiger aswanensis]|uniref:5-methylcytosine-specific restriction enzyme subunit McrC n=1 Tax=Halopiger aswanensis TaxID=148449 RepID=A0A419WJL6_9EURY|nr:restriction endonuclease [Halopiger aswanensis]RKD95616.1 5-methylcytosine-specific restriction enzyme subunit McrC [Halopiger aswanensis]
MCADWIIEEYDDKYIPQSELSDTDIRYLDEELDSELELEGPSSLNDWNWVIWNDGYVGHIQLPENSSIELKPGIDLDNVFGMLEYAYDLSKFNLAEEGLYDSESVQDFYDKIASIFAQSVNKRRKQGLFRSYQDREEESQRIRGRIDFRKTAQRPWDPKAHVKYREMTSDNEDNQILLYTLNRISRSDVPREDTLEKVRKGVRSLRGSISYREFEPSDCVGRRYNRLNQDYQRMHALARLILDTSGPSHEEGDADMIPYTVYMPDLYELFVARWLNENLPTGYSVDTQKHEDLGDTGLFYRIDVVLNDDRTGETVAVLDTKYREPDNESPDTSEVNQVLGYAKKMETDKAFLVYPAELDNSFPLQLDDVDIHCIKFALEDGLERNGREFLTDLSSVLGRPDLLS